MRQPVFPCAFLLVIFGVALAEDGDAVALAESAAAAWLELTDQGNYEETWTQSSSLFQMAISREDWTNALNAARAPLGALVSRARNSAGFYRELPGAPDGEYVVLTFDSVFDKKARAVETVTVMKDSDAWRVSGYFIR